jgi:lipopolysaccharide/colanic/teichoic acid biosynthesis glycosyltransferase
MSGLRRATRLAMFVVSPAVVLAMSKWHAVSHDYDFTGSFRFAWALSFALLLVLAAYAVGIPDGLERRRAPAAGALAVVAAAAAISVIQLVVGDALLPRFVVFGSAVVLVPIYVLLVSVSAGNMARLEERVRVVFVGDVLDAQMLGADVRVQPEHPVQVVKTMTLDQAQPSVTSPHPLALAVAETAATIIVLSREAQLDELIVHEAAALHEVGVRVRTLSLFYEQWLGKLPLQELERTSLMFDISELHRPEYSRAKRLLDVSLASVGALVLLPLVPLVVVGNVVANRGPLFYRQLRVGKGGSTFEILKFRTMRPQGGALVNEWTVEDDPRITPFGRVLRKTHLDEMPQMLNILRGDLSIVGPRPEQPAYVEELVAKLPFYAFRHLVRPGLTGWAQVKYGYAGNESDALEKLQYDFYYLRHQSVRFDLRIIGRTLRSVVGRRGR